MQRPSRRRRGKVEPWTREVVATRPQEASYGLGAELAWKYGMGIGICAKLTGPDQQGSSGMWSIPLSAPHMYTVRVYSTPNGVADHLRTTIIGCSHEGVMMCTGRTEKNWSLLCVPVLYVVCVSCSCLLIRWVNVCRGACVSSAESNAPSRSCVRSSDLAALVCVKTVPVAAILMAGHCVGSSVFDSVACLIPEIVSS